MSVEIPDTPGAEDRGDESKPGLRALLTGGGLVLAVFLVIAALTPPGVEEEENTANTEGATTTTSVAPLNDPLDWHPDEIGTIWPHRLVEFEGSLYFFGSPGDRSQFQLGEGLDAWLLVDGVTWKSLGTAFERPNQIHTVSATPQGLVAAGAGDGTTLHLWTSTDAVAWQESELPDTPSTPNHFTTWAQAVGGTDDVTVVFASHSADIMNLIRDALPNHDAPLGISWGGPSFQVYVQGPLGLTAFAITAEDIGLTEEEGREAIGGMGPDQTSTWASIDGHTWTQVDVGLQYVNDVFEVGGELIATGFGTSGSEIWGSRGGFDWGRMARGGLVEHLNAWRGGFVATRPLGVTPDIAYSEDRETWESIGLGQYLDDRLSWHIQTLAAGEGGVAAVVSGYDERGFDFQDQGPVVVERNGYELTINGSGSVLFGSEDEVLLRLNMHSNQVYEEVAVDFEDQSVTFLHPDSLEPLASFTFDELEQAEADLYGNQSFAEEEQLIAFSSDGLTWTVESVSDVFGQDVYVNDLHVTDNQVVAVATEFSNRFSRVPDTPNIVIWTAVIP